VKEIIEKLGLMKIKNFCSVKNSVTRIRRQAIYWEKIFAKDTFDKGLLSVISKELLKLSGKKTTSLRNEPRTLTDTSLKKIH